MKFLKKLWKKDKKETKQECADGHNCDFIEDVDETMVDMNEKIDRILNSDSFSRLMKRDTERV